MPTYFEALKKFDVHQMAVHNVDLGTYPVIVCDDMYHEVYYDFKTSDGEIFADREQAVRHEEEYLLSSQ